MKERVAGRPIRPHESERSGCDDDQRPLEGVSDGTNPHSMRTGTNGTYIQLTSHPLLRGSMIPC
jgi:hypothetical protein